MKTFATIGEGPDRSWRTPGERVRGEAQLLADFARELERAMKGKRLPALGVLGIVNDSNEVYEAWVRLRWSYEPGPANLVVLGKLLRSIEGPQHRFNRRWNGNLQRSFWGFDPA